MAAARRQTLAFDRGVSEFFMRLALEEAARGLGRTRPNPAVGAVLVRAGRVVGRGFHRRAGGPHAEIVAIRAAGKEARGADLYTTLEPCNHFGRTPPCTEAIARAGIRRVVFASSDPNPLVNGKGARSLRRCGVEVQGGVLAEQADRLNRPFFKHIRTGMPWVTLKVAATLDGKLATLTGDSRWVTGAAARRWVHRLRDQADVVLVGANTAALDDPRLTARLRGGRDPVRVVLDSRLRTALGRKLFRQQRSTAPTIVATTERGPSTRAARLSRQGVQVWTLPARAGRVDLRALLKRLGGEGYLHVLVEGGAEVFADFLRQQLADELLLFLAPKLVGRSGLSWVGELGIKRMAQARRLRSVEIEAIGPDYLLRGLL